MPMCYKCRETKNADEFYRGKNMEHREGCHSYCKECQKKTVIAGKKKKRQEYRAKVIEGYGSKCCVCGVDDIRVLALDHVNDNGAQERREWRGKMDFFYEKIIKSGFPPEYQLLCANCNAIKEYERRALSDT